MIGILPFSRPRQRLCRAVVEPRKGFSPQTLRILVPKYRNLSKRDVHLNLFSLYELLFEPSTYDTSKQTENRKNWRFEVANGKIIDSRDYAGSNQIAALTWRSLYQTSCTFPNYQRTRFKSGKLDQITLFESSEFMVNSSEEALSTFKIIYKKVFELGVVAAKMNL